MSQETILQIEEDVLVLLKQKPMTPTQLANHFGMTREHFSRKYLYPMINAEKIVKIDGTNYYQPKGFSITAKKIERELADSSKFSECQSIKNWRARNSAKHREQHIKRFELLCLGKSKYLKNFRINPDAIVYPQDIEKIIELYKEQHKADSIPKGLNLILRRFIVYGLKISLEQADGDALGISGDKGKPQVATLHMSKEQYHDAKELLKSDEVSFCKFGFRFGTFCRPSSMYTVEIDDLEFYPRTVEYIDDEGDIITDKKSIKFLKKQGFTVQSKTTMACRLEIFENKTQIKYPKYIFDQEVVEVLEKFAEKRRRAGFKYLFWNDNKTIFDFHNYDKICENEVVKDNKIFVDIFYNPKIGFKKGDFGRTDRANYAIRHFGVQDWLQKTNYNYGLIAEMGWEDINTLRLWYGRRTVREFEKSIGEILA